MYVQILLFLAIQFQIAVVHSDNELAEDIFGFTAKDIKGELTHFSEYKGKVSFGWHTIMAYYWLCSMDSN